MKKPISSSHGAPREFHPAHELNPQPIPPGKSSVKKKPVKKKRAKKKR